MAIEVKREQFDISSAKKEFVESKDVEFDGYISGDTIFSALTGFDLHYEGGNTYEINNVQAETSIDDTREKSATVKVTADFAWEEGHASYDDIFAGQVSVVVVAETG